MVEVDRVNTKGKPTRHFQLALGVSLLAALIQVALPERTMPRDYHAMLWISLPLAGVWLIFTCGSFVYFGRKAVWMLLGSPLVLYWPVWLIVHGIPHCYWQRNCI